MKKSVIISILLIYIVAIVVVGTLGQKLQVYNPIVYVESIECNTENYNTYSEQDKEKQNADGFIWMPFSKDVRIDLKCWALPNNATNKDLNYLFDDKNNKKMDLEKHADYTASITFHEFVPTVTITVKAADNFSINAKLKIKILLYEI